MFLQRHGFPWNRLGFLIMMLLVAAAVPVRAEERPEIFVQTGHSARIESVAFSPDGRHAVSGSWDKGLVLWEVESGREVRRFSGHSDAVISVAFSPDGRYLLSGSWDRTLRLWEVKTGREVRQVGGYARGLAVSPDGGRVLVGDAADSLNMLDIKSGNKAGRFPANSGAGAIAFSADGKYALTGGWDGSLRLWDVENGTMTRRFKGHSGKITSVALSTDGMHALSGGMDKAIRLWDISTGEEVHRFEGHPKGVTAVAFSPDGALAFSGGLDGAVRSWDVRQGNEKKLFKGYTDAVTSIAVSPEGNLVLAGSADSTMRLWDTATGNEVRRFSGEPGVAATAVYRHGGSKEAVGTRYSFSDGEWAVVTNENFYSSSPHADRRLNLRMGNDVYGLDQFRDTFFNPARVEAALKGEPAGAGRQAPGVRPPSFVITSPVDGRRVTTAQTEITLRVDGGVSGIKKLGLLVNGKLAPVLDTVMRGAAAGQELRIPVSLAEGENVVEVVASNGLSEARKTLRIYSEDTTARHEKSLPDLWLLAVGINQYQDRKIVSLSHAGEDARAVAASFAAQEGKMYRKVHTLVISDAGLLKPTLKNIRDSLGFLMHARQEDQVVVFLAGHGVEDGSGDFVFFPGDMEMNDKGAIDSAGTITLKRDLERIVRLPARKMIVIDACRTLKQGEEKDQKSDLPAILRAFGDDRTVVFAASGSGEESAERAEWKHGVFSYALVDGLSGKADADGDGVVYMKELDEYVSRVVARATRGLQHPAAYASGKYLDFAVAMLR